MVLAISFPDQDSFYERMGVELYENYPEVIPIYKRCKRICGIDLVQTLIYENKEQDWDEESRKIAVMVSSVVMFAKWKNLYQIEPDYYMGRGIGLLAALVCDKVISLASAIHLIQGRKINRYFIKKNNTPILSLRGNKLLSGIEDIREELEVYRKNTESYGSYEESIKQLGIEQVLDIGPGNVTAINLYKRLPDIIVGYIDKSFDTNYILEHFQYRKNHSRYYCVSRILGIITSTKNGNSSQDTYAENVVEAYLLVKEVVDKANMALYQGKPVIISDEDYSKCLEMLKVNFRYKQTAKAEVTERLRLLEGETLLSFRNGFQEIDA